MRDYEKLGVLYLGKEYDITQRAVTNDLLLYKSKHLTTHAVCVGMTGSGKTGLGIALLEEAAIDGIPVIAIDPKGDLGNLLLGFPDLRPGDFAPWIDAEEVSRRGETLAAAATETAERWSKGLADWGQDGKRIARLREAVDLSIYTPGSNVGRPLSILASFTAPAESLLEQDELYRERISSAVSGLLSLVGIADDPISGREHILLSMILDSAWRGRRDLDMAGIIQAVQSPGFEKVGVLDLETFFPGKDRLALAMRLNNLVASPRFAGWLLGERLEIDRLLSAPNGKPRVSILSIAHLADTERMFFVTILLNEILSWVRSQSGTSSLRAVLYMDEIFGYVPPTANPPSKVPMLTLLKQARAFGLGVVLATQNPVDLDYKGLSNAGTWFLGRLQTKRDNDRVLDGLQGAATAAGKGFDRGKMDRLLSGLASRVFVMSNVHEDEPVVFQARWTLSYLAGPLSREQIGRLMAPLKAQDEAESRDRESFDQPDSGEARTGPKVDSAQELPASSLTVRSSQPVGPVDVSVFFAALRDSSNPAGSIVYHPAVIGSARLHYVDRKAAVDLWERAVFLARGDQRTASEIWVDSEPWMGALSGEGPLADAQFHDLPARLLRAKNYSTWAKSFKNYLYRERGLTLLRCEDLKAWSRPGESEHAFRLRLGQVSREERDRKLEKLVARYKPRQAALAEKIRKAQDQLAREQAQASQSTWNATISFGGTVLGALLGKKTLSRATVSKASTTARAVTKAAQSRGDVDQAAATLDQLRQDQFDLDRQFELEVEQESVRAHPEALIIEPTSLAPRKADIEVENIGLVWLPYRLNADGSSVPGY